ncbi:UBX domain-containing protein 1 [Toxorhynchites rutilus septentrionalis]|uniref:UBX domain-containing protein 1 n=1 Tax=Toxorhynchites rutilus septentrionalis TaxID=329112 RepID=UPI00247AB9BC|nr:UBX domain-containing protein 1 [Toxorhynchites rutilus septentrionalis]
MSDIQTLIDMGFPEEKAKRALEVTNHKGVEAAMEWLLAHADEDIPSSSGSLAAQPEQMQTSAEDSTASTGDASSSEPAAVAKSLKCDECGKLFKSQDEVEFHAAKTNHSSFSESTEEKKPLTEDERKAQLALLEDKMKRKRLEREENDKKEAQERERLRIKSGKDMLEARRKLEEQEMKKIMDQRKREKMEEKAARDRVKAQIEADKAARKAKQSGEITTSPPVTAVVSPPAADQTVKPAAAKNYSNARIQIRLLDGSTLVETFEAKEQLAAVRLFVQLKLGTNPAPFGLMTSFPRKVFSPEDYDVPLEQLGLVPSAVLIVTKSP